MKKQIRVIIADDSPFVCRLLSSYFSAASDFEVVATALNGRNAVERVRHLRPDAVTMDLEMPELDGLEALRQIMRECPTPVVVISGASGKSATRTLQALDLGAVDFVLKYAPGTNLDPAELRHEIVAKVRAASRIRVIRLLEGGQSRPFAPPPRIASAAMPEEQSPAELNQAVTGGLIVIGASTGGPLALRELLSGIPADFPAAIVIVQHMPASFTGVLAAQLRRHVPIDVREAEDGDVLRPGLALVAQGGVHLLLRPGMRVALRPGQAYATHCPSIDVTMESAAQIYGSRVKGVVLTGMGEDGSLGLAAIRAKGGATYAQDGESCVINGMPLRAIEKGVVDYIAPPWQIAQMLVRHSLKTERSAYVAQV
jgi:two-component system chemotaxis response regulator CheB